MLRVNIVGIGPGNPKLLTGAALEAINQSTILIGDKRMLANFASEKRFYDTIKAAEICNICANANPEKDIVSILVSGDVGFSALPKLSAASCRIVNVCVFAASAALFILRSSCKCHGTTQKLSACTAAGRILLKPLPITKSICPYRRRKFAAGSVRQTVPFRAWWRAGLCW